jgi:hypothetical protein
MYSKATSLPRLYVRNIMPGDMSVPSLVIRGRLDRGYAASQFTYFRLVSMSSPPPLK